MHNQCVLEDTENSEKSGSGSATRTICQVVKTFKKINKETIKQKQHFNSALICYNQVKPLGGSIVVAYISLFVRLHVSWFDGSSSVFFLRV